MKSRCKTGMGMASTAPSGRGVGWRGSGVQLLNYRGLLVVALLFVMATTFGIEDAHCSISTADAVAPSQSTQQSQHNVTFNQYEADALNAIFRKWSKQNPQLSSVLKWSLDRHPCDNQTAAFGKNNVGNVFQGAWIGVECTLELLNPTEISKRYHVSVTSLTIFGSNSDCPDSDQCGFDGIIGQLPSEIGILTNLEFLLINNNPKLTGPVPVEIFQMPNLEYLSLRNNSLNGTLHSDVNNTNCQLVWIDLSHNNFSGSLRVSSQEILFCSSLFDLNVEFNQLDGPLDLGDWNGGEYSTSLDFSNNHFGGTFSIGHLFNVQDLDLSCNDFTNIQFTNSAGPSQSSGLNTIYMPSLRNL